MELRKTALIEPNIDEASHWRLSWSAAFAGALSTLASITILGLFGTAAGVGSLSEIKDFSTWHEVSLVTLAAVVAGAFFSNVVGGWVAGKIIGTRFSEPSMLHGAIAWLVSVPMLIVLLALGAGKTFGGWYGGIMGSMGTTGATMMQSPLAVRHTATAAATSLLVGLIGSVIGGWMASGEPMSFTHHRSRTTSSQDIKRKGMA